MTLEGKWWGYFSFSFRFFFSIVKVEREWMLLGHSEFPSDGEREAKLRNTNNAIYKQLAWTLCLLNPSTIFHFSTPISRKGNIRPFQQMKIQRPCSKDQDVTSTLCSLQSLWERGHRVSILASSAWSNQPQHLSQVGSQGKLSEHKDNSRSEC